MCSHFKPKKMDVEPMRKLVGGREMDKVHFSTGKDDWETPQWLFNQLDDEFHFTLDPCCTAENAKCRKYYTKAENGLEQDWKGETVFCNPPYSRGKKRCTGTRGVD